MAFISPYRYIVQTVPGFLFLQQHRSVPCSIAYARWQQLRVCLNLQAYAAAESGHEKKQGITDHANPESDHVLPYVTYDM